MDIGTISGCIIGCFLLICAIVFGGQDGFAPFWNIPSLLIVFGGSAAALLIAFPIKPIIQTCFAVRKCFVPLQGNAKEGNAKEMVDQVVNLAESARREGLLAQEKRVDDIEDPFLAEGLQLIVDGLQPAVVESILNSEIEALHHRHQQIRNVILYGGRCAPAFGMIGTLIGLVLMLTHLDVESVGPGMAVAVLTTLYGIIAAHLVFLPIAEKLKQHHEAEMRIKAMIVRGLLAIQGGEHPRIIQMKLWTFLPPELRPSEEQREMMHEIQAISLPPEDEAEQTKQAA